MTIILS
jgi:hypothetical protein